MTTTAIIISILFIVSLTSSVATRSVGLITADDKPSQKFVIPLIFGVSQGLAAVIGYNLGRLIDACRGCQDVRRLDEGAERQDALHG